MTQIPVLLLFSRAESGKTLQSKAVRAGHSFVGDLLSLHRDIRATAGGTRQKIGHCLRFGTVADTSNSNAMADIRIVRIEIPACFKASVKTGIMNSVGAQKKWNKAYGRLRARQNVCLEIVTGTLPVQPKRLPFMRVKRDGIPAYF